MPPSPQTYPYHDTLPKSTLYQAKLDYCYILHLYKIVIHWQPLLYLMAHTVVSLALSNSYLTIFVNMIVFSVLSFCTRVRNTGWKMRNIGGGLWLILIVLREVRSCSRYLNSGYTCMLMLRNHLDILPGYTAEFPKMHKDRLQAHILS